MAVPEFQYAQWGNNLGQNLVQGMQQRRELQTRNALAAALPGVLDGSNPDAIKQIFAADPQTGFAVQKYMGERGDAVAKNDREQLDAVDKWASGALANSQNPEADYAEIRRLAIQRLQGNKFLPQAAERLPEQWTPALLAAARGVSATSAPDTASAIQVHKYYQSLDPAGREEFMGTLRAPKVIDFGGNFGVVNPTNPTGTPTPIGYKTPPPEQMPDFKGRQAEATEIGKGRGERVVEAPKAFSALNAATAKWDNVDRLIEQALPNVTYATAGLGSLTSAIPGSPAANLKATLEGIEANLAFNELGEMRANSPTGGALGSVTDTEGRLLSQAIASVKASQSPQQLKQNLNVLRGLLKLTKKRLGDAYTRQYGATEQSPSQPPAAPAGGGNRPPLSSY